uniref:Glucose dehydrogenase n=1 Tax=Timema cristinae TaxID=61476 RepID=A0A7R9D2Q7_TIMCR|nr:unnamed protein product [Timema cristinae]
MSTGLLCIDSNAKARRTLDAGSRFVVFTIESAVATNTTACVINTANNFMTIFSTLIAAQTQNRSTELIPKNTEFDFIVVGGGSTGYVLARRLSEVPSWNIFILEAGGKEPDIADIPGLYPFLRNTSMNWKYMTVPDNSSCNSVGYFWAGGKVLGRSSVLNAMLHVRESAVATNTTACVINTANNFMTIFSTLIAAQTQNRSTELIPKNTEFDFIVVGGGSTGYVLARRLSEVPSWNIFILEAGGKEPDIADIPGLYPFLRNTSMNWKYMTVPDNSSCNSVGYFWAGGKVLGRSSVLNAMLHVRGNSEDYNH